MLEIEKDFSFSLYYVWLKKRKNGMTKNKYKFL